MTKDVKRLPDGTTIEFGRKLTKAEKKMARKHRTKVHLARAGKLKEQRR